MPVNLENAKRILLATLLTGLCWALPGCQSITPTTNYAEIRFIDASPNAPGLDFYETAQAVDYNVGFSPSPPHTGISPGTYRFSANTAGTSQTLVSTVGSVSTGHQYTVLVSNLLPAWQRPSLLTRALRRRAARSPYASSMKPRSPARMTSTWCPAARRCSMCRRY